MSEETKKQVFEMSVGIVVHAAVIALVCLFVSRTFSAFMGILAGMITAIGLLISIAHSTELCVESQDEQWAKRKMATHAVIRSLVVIALVFILWLGLKFNPLTYILSVLGLKTGAYLYSFVHRKLDGPDTVIETDVIDSETVPETDQ